MRSEEVKNLSDEELVNKLNESKTELFNLRFQHAAGQLDNPNRIPLVKKDIARVLTVLAEREVAVTVPVKKPEPAAKKKQKEQKPKAKEAKKEKASTDKKETKTKKEKAAQ